MRVATKSERVARRRGSSEISINIATILPYNLIFDLIRDFRLHVSFRYYRNIIIFAVCVLSSSDFYIKRGIKMKSRLWNY